MRSDGRVTGAVCQDALQLLEVDAHGFDESDRRLLRTIIDKFAGGPVGLNSLAAAIGEEKDAIEDIYEPYLIQIGFLDRTSRGRVATARAYEYFGLIGSGKGTSVVAGLRPVKIAGLSTYVPPRVLSNFDLEKMVETSDEWILQRTGIRERHIVDPGVATSDIAAPAALGAIAEAGLTPKDIGFIVVGTTTPDTIFPSTACTLQAKIGAVNAWGFDLGAACSGFTYALSIAYQQVATGAAEHALVVGADVMSSIIDYTDRSTCVLFGDGAGAAVVSAAGAGRAGDSRLPAHHGRHRRPGAVHARGRQPAAGVARDGRSTAALREAGRRHGLQVCGQDDRGDLAPHPGSQRPDGQRHRPVRLAPGQPPHHRSRDAAARACRRRRSSSISKSTATRPRARFRSPSPRPGRTAT